MRMMVGVGLLACALAACAGEPWSAVISPDNSLRFHFARAGRQVFTAGVAGWGPRWAWVGISAKDKATGDELVTSAPFVVNKANGDVITVKCQAKKSGERAVAFRYDLSAAKDVPITFLIVSISAGREFNGSKVTLKLADGAEDAVTLPFGRYAKPATAKAVFGFKDAGDVAVAFDPPCELGFDGDMRVVLAKEVFRQGTRAVTMTVTFPAEVAFRARQEDLDELVKPLADATWFPFAPTNDTGPSVIGVEPWLERPAGKRGGVRMARDRFELEDGTPIKFWGTNLSYALSAPPKPEAEFTAARFAKYGVNCVRMHKFSGKKGWEGIGDPNDATKMDPEGLERLDYFSAELKKRGVYFAWSHTFGFHVRPGNADRLAAYDEIMRNLKGNTYAFINIAEDVQDLMIEMVVNLLKHKNPYTGLTYAEEPALAYIELHNEDDIFFYTNTRAVEACPTYKKLLMARWADWLKAKYGSQEGLKAAWGEALAAGESLEKKNLALEGNPWFFGADHLPGQKGGRRQRLLDNAAFFHDVQNKFYSRFVKAIRDAGYKGPLCGSPWQAPAMVPHYYNLRSDWLVGFIDRHNYFGGGLTDTMLKRPGSGYFSSGLQQVADRPFGLSEWIHVYPSLYSAEGPAIIATYGMGLQGWDASFEFQSRSGRDGFAGIVGKFPWGVWEADVPTQLGQYPALARMVLRGDVKEGEVISVRRVSLPELAEGNFAFADKVVQQGDIKSFTGSVPMEALAAGRVVVEFTDKPQPPTFPDMKKHLKGDTAIASTTGQLLWDFADRGFFTVDTPGTKAVVGFAQGREFTLGNVKLKMDCPYASVFVTALDKDATLATAKSALISAVARNANTGFKVFALDGRVIENGAEPVLLEPVKATIAISGRPIVAVNVLDHDGRRTNRTIPVQDGQFALDTGRDKALYYEIAFQ